MPHIENVKWKGADMKLTSMSNGVFNIDYRGIVMKDETLRDNWFS